MDAIENWLNLQLGRFPDDYDDEDDETELVSATAVDIDYSDSPQHVESSPEKLQVLLLQCNKALTAKLLVFV